MLKAAFELKDRKVRLNQTQKQQLEPLVEECISSIQSCIYYHGDTFSVDHGPKYLILRSGLQFIIEDFKSMQSEYDDECSEFKDTVQYFTECLESWKNRKGSEDFLNYATHTDDQLRRPEGIPDGHIWWLDPIV